MLDALEEMDEGLGRLVQLFDGSWAVHCVSCGLMLRDFVQYREHVDHGGLHQRRSRVLARKNKKAIAKWEEHRRLLRRELGLDP